MELWTSNSGTSLATLDERVTTSVALPINPSFTPTIQIISGSLPRGLRIEGYNLKGTPFEVQRSTVSEFVIRATLDGIIQDRTFTITVEGSDEPVWITNPDLLPIGPNNSFFILDSEPLDFQLQAIDPDVSAGDNILYTLKDKDGVLPPGIQLTEDGRLVGIVEPILALDKRSGNGYYDTVNYAATPYDFGILSANGFDSFYYDSTFYDYADITQSPKKLNRYFQFTVIASDGDTSVERTFRIFVVGDDFLRSDNTVLKVANGLFTSDNTYVRTPIWITPANLGTRRANNYITVFLDTIDPPTLTGTTVYSLRTLNPDGSDSLLPTGLELDQTNGELAGTIPYQPAITKDYKFTIRAQRFSIDSNLAFITGTFYQDTLAGTRSFRIVKMPTDLSDGVDDLRDLVGRSLSINSTSYVVESVQATNPDYDIITLTEPLRAKFDVIVADAATTGDSSVYVNRLVQRQREQLIKRFINLADGEANQIQSIVPYVEWQIRTFSGDDNIEINFQELTVLDEPTDAVKYADFESLPTLREQVEAIFSKQLNFPVEVTTDSESNFIFKAPSTLLTRANKIKSIFVTKDSSSDIEHVLLNDSKDRIFFDVALQRNLGLGRNIGIALYYNDGFIEEIIVSDDSELNSPFRDKTFTMKVIGEVDSTITWNTDSDLGQLTPNFVSTLSLSATTTVLDSNLLYKKISGRLPPGLHLSYDGEIIGKVRQFPDGSLPGLTSFDGGDFVFDNNSTTMDRDYYFTVQASDRYGISATEKEFVVHISDPKDQLYSNIKFSPMMKQNDRLSFRNFISNPDVFPSELIYRPNDPEFGIQKQINILAYAGIETKFVNEFVAAVSQNHKRKRLFMGDVKTAVAKQPGTNEIVYEVVYIEVNDPLNANNGITRNSILTKNTNSITVDSIQYETKEDQFKTDAGVPTLAIEGVEIVDERFFFKTRDGNNVTLLPGAAGVLTRDGLIIDVVKESDSAPFKFRPNGDTIKTDNTAVKVSNPNDGVKYISNIDNMRQRISDLGVTERDFLPLWMRTTQEGGIQEIGYTLAIPLCYCKPNASNDIALNIKNSGYDFKMLNLEIDRYIIDSTKGNSSDQYIAFANYAYNI